MPQLTITKMKLCDEGLDFDDLPVLSAQLITAPTGRPNEMRNFPPAEPPRP